VYFLTVVVEYRWVLYEEEEADKEKIKSAAAANNSPPQVNQTAQALAEASKAPASLVQGTPIERKM